METGEKKLRIQRLYVLFHGKILTTILNVHFASLLHVFDMDLSVFCKPSSSSTSV